MTAERFEEPWHAQLFALTVALNEAGHLDWCAWSEALGAAMARRSLDRELDGGSDYYAAWLEALEDLLDRLDLVDPVLAREMREAWERAYLATPHGRPVRLSERETL